MTPDIVYYSTKPAIKLRNRPGYLKHPMRKSRYTPQDCRGATRASWRRQETALKKTAEGETRQRWLVAHLASAPFRAKKVWALEEARQKKLRGK